MQIFFKSCIDIFLKKAEFVDNNWRLNLPDSKRQAYRAFRIVQFGPNNVGKDKGSKNYLSASGFELFGTLFLEVYKDEEDEEFLNNMKVIYKNREIRGEDGIIKYLKKQVIVYASSIKRGTARDFISSGKAALYTENEPFSWFAVDFGEDMAVSPSGYSIRYSGNAALSYPTHWLLQASNKPEALHTNNPNSRLWKTLRMHLNDVALKEGKSCTFEISGGNQSAYRLFRVIQTKENFAVGNTDYEHVFGVDSFELYGTLQKRSIVGQQLEERPKKQKSDWQTISKNDMISKTVELEKTVCIKNFQASSRIRYLCVVDEVVYVASDRPVITAFDLAEGHMTQELSGHLNGVLWLVLDKQRGRLISTSWDSTIKIWDLETGKCLETLKGHTDAVTCAVLHDQEGTQLLYSCSDDGTICIWRNRNDSSFQNAKQIQAHNSRIPHMIHSENKIFTCSSGKKKEEFVIGNRLTLLKQIKLLKLGI